ncbi:hypothetical protein MKZ38_003810 [Zalerion maritima]|uniref:Glycosyltransferase family 28 N-terminal domain-containing protein n=1 Tax=Zalerion maritima TaxID=339359 RepID=A0AAD5RNB3_9PEZI|nr:hypothetical protein MKZ38_003810 [Zalerion maritima]
MAERHEFDPPPPYSETVNSIPSEFFNGRTRLAGDGRIDIDLDSRLCKTLSRIIPDLKHPSGEPSSSIAGPSGQPWGSDLVPAYSEHAAQYFQSYSPQHEEVGPPVPPTLFPLTLNIVIQVVGSRGDVQPFIALGSELKKHGHRVRLATHNTFAKFVRDSGLEFFPIGGDPAELMAYMVRNPGLIPSMKSLRAGDVQSKRKMVAEMLEGCWRSCVEPEPQDPDWGNAHLRGKPFVADVIIANPPSFAHVHCAQALGVPVHLMFTMPWTSTRAFPHPLTNLKVAKGKAGKVKSGGVDPEVANYISYGVVEFMTWQGLGDVINKFRKSLDLEPIAASEGPLIAETLKIPFTYCWSPALVPKPIDWPSNIDVCGFFFRDPPDYTPPPNLAAFLKNGPLPVYIGFGSIVIDDLDRMTHTILEAVRSTGARALISRGWSSLGGGAENIEGDDIFYLGDCPHEWLFQNVAAVIHHGGAGTTACGLLNGRPTTIVPFFGDQPFWGNMVAAAGAGPEPIPQKTLNTNNLANAIQFCLTREAFDAAQGIAAKMRAESGVQAAVKSFHSHLPVRDMQCDILKGQPASWVHKGKGGVNVKLSKVAVGILVDHLRVDVKHLKLCPHERHKVNTIVTDTRRWDPITGTASAALGVGTGLVTATANIVARPIKVYRQRTLDHHGSETDMTRDMSLRDDVSSTASSRHKSSQVDDTLSSRRSQANSPSIRKSHTYIASSPSVSAATWPAAENGSQNGKGKAVAIHHNAGETGGAIALAAASGVGDFLKCYSRGFFVEIPLACAEGLREAPRLYGDEVKDHGPIKGWKSGGMVAGKNFLDGMTSGVTGMVMQPYHGGKEEGAVGAMKGVGKGMLGMTTKMGSAGLGLFAYSAQGAYKSLRNAARSDTRNAIVAARLVEGEYLVTVERGWEGRVPVVLHAFDTLKSGNMR